ncbi:MAG TPA: helix-turn-helix domain-containing protein [Kofleriaceae bacterium]|nr:helix-turn-helix domain-containing protein [Kofleriaceae bacterium]
MCASLTASGPVRVVEAAGGRLRRCQLEAKQLLAAGVRPSAVALRVGFDDQSQLHRHFRRLVGTAPGEYWRASRRR